MDETEDYYHSLLRLGATEDIFAFRDLAGDGKIVADGQVTNVQYQCRPTSIVFLRLTLAARDWSRASKSDLCAIGLGSIPRGEQLLVV